MRSFDGVRLGRAVVGIRVPFFVRRASFGSAGRAAAIVIATGLATRVSAGGAGAAARGTERRCATPAGRRAAAAQAVAARGAARRALVADVGEARLATGRFARDGEGGAVVAANPLPIVERDVGAPRVVGRQDARHDREGVEEPAGGERLLEGDEPRAGAQPFVADVGVGHAGVGPSGAGIDGDDAQRERGSDGREVEPDLKRPERERVEFDRGGDDDELVPVEDDVRKLLGEGRQIAREVAAGDRRNSAGFVGVLAAPRLEPSDELVDGGGEPPANDLLGAAPRVPSAAAATAFETTDEPPGVGGGRRCGRGGPRAEQPLDLPGEEETGAERRSVRYK
ncbi:MAG: hypothetical protein KF802_16600 [Bdellovibrionaceae bacterium]|nr:hypothetical protein [Pseudobdellovibrionaceae bacterium]